MPAAWAAWMPASLSSRTRQSAGAAWAFSAAFRKISGQGLPRSISVPKTMSSKYCTTPSRVSTSTARSRTLEVASTTATPSVFSQDSRAAAPGLSCTSCSSSFSRATSQVRPSSTVMGRLYRAMTFVMLATPVLPL